MLLTSLQSFRTQFLFRLGKLQRFVLIFRGLNSCDLGRGTKIGGGLHLIHGFGVVINSKATIGFNCTIYQNVTIGEVKGEVPVIGNHVFIGAGALVMGGVHVGDNVRIGAGAIVIDDVPDNCTVVSPKARIVRKVNKQ